MTEWVPFFLIATQNNALKWTKGIAGKIVFEWEYKSRNARALPVLLNQSLSLTRRDAVSLFQICCYFDCKESVSTRRGKNLNVKTLQLVNVTDLGGRGKLTLWKKNRHANGGDPRWGCPKVRGCEGRKSTNLAVLLLCIFL